jgi:hypothetical protein
MRMLLLKHTVDGAVLISIKVTQNKISSVADIYSYIENSNFSAFTKLNDRASDKAKYLIAIIW